MTDDEWFTALERAVRELAAVDPDTLDAAVPSCPGWDVRDVLAHTTSIHRWVDDIVRSRASEWRRREPVELTTGPEVGALLLANGTQVLATLQAADLDEEVITWAGPRPVRWWLRRLVHETTVHAWDAASASGEALPIEAATAVDGLDEVFDVIVPAAFDATRNGGAGQTAHLHATDAPGEWLARFDPDRVVVTREHAKGSVAARGPASELLLFTLGRVPLDRLEVFGDIVVLDQLTAAARFD